MTIEQIAVLLSLLLTILGWSVTAYYQRKILERQIASEWAREARQLVIPAKVKQLEDMRLWMEEGYRLWALRLSVPEQLHLSDSEKSQRTRDIDEEFYKWQGKYRIFRELADMIDPVEEGKNEYERMEYLGPIITSICENLPVNESRDKFRSPNNSFVFFYPTLINRIDRLIERIAISEVQGNKMH